MGNWYLTIRIALGLVLVVTVPLSSGVFGYDKYADDTSENPLTTNCAACHGDFNAGTYTELEPGGQSWGDNLMNVHLTMLASGNGGCNTCHSSGGRSPVFTNSSTGGTGLMAISCTGCHGRLADAPGAGTDGAGAGLRRHHIRTGASDCWESCHNHADADPSAVPAVLVGEDTLPEYYANPGSGHSIPTSPCDSSEDIAGSSNGQDNDGERLYEGADPDCPCPASATPGEVSVSGLPQVQVTAHDFGTGRITVTYGETCCATDNNFYFGLLSNLATYTYSGRDCSITNSGAYDWFYPADGQSYFFLIVADDGTVEGSYGMNTASNSERDEDFGCEPRNLSVECN